MLKKVIIVAGVLLVGGWLFAKTDLGSYIRTGWRSVKTAVAGSVPIDFEIKRAKDMLANLDRADDRLISAIASQMASIKKLDRDVETMQANLGKEKEDLRVRNDDYKNGKTFLTSGTVSKERFALDLERRFSMFKQMERTVKSKAELLSQHQAKLQAAKEQRESLKVERADLEARISKLETELEILKAAEARSKCAVDNSQLTELNSLRQLLDSLESRIDTGMIEMQLRDEARPSVTAPSTPSVRADLSAEIDAFLNKDGNVAADKK